MKLKLLFPVLMLLIGSFIMVGQVNAQIVIKGQVVEKGSEEPLVAVSVASGRHGVVTDVEGRFELKIPQGKTLTLRYVGYETQTIKLPKGLHQVDLGVIQMGMSAFGLDEVVVIASVVPKDRMTPVPVSNVTMKEIQAKAPNGEFPEVLKATPSVYVTKGGGGFGDSRINMRGFDSNNLGVLINGVPINDMESGKVYWSNWAGLSDVASFVQVQRGLGASKLGISSVGGTINMVTKSVDAKRGGSFYSGVGNDGYNKLAFNVSTGLMDNGWAITLSAARNAGNGYVKATNFLGWSYFANISKKINADHTLSFTAFGAPQWHNQRQGMALIEDYHNSPEGGRRNIGYGYLNGELTTLGYNFYHKPQMSLNHYWTIDETSTWASSLYVSTGRGGGRRVLGNNDKWMKYDYVTGRRSSEFMMTDGGLVDFDGVVAANRASLNGSQAIFANSCNSHNWYGLLSSYSKRFDSGIKLTAGYDGRYYRGMHYRQIDNLLGGDYYIEPVKRKLMYNDPYQPLKVGDRTAYDNDGIVLWNGLFAQTEYVQDDFNAFLSGSITSQQYRYVNNGGTGEKAPLAEGQTKYVSEWANYMPWSVKAGAGYKFADHHNVFMNAGYFVRAPFFRSVFFNYNTMINKGAKNERVFTGELGYGLRFEKFRFDINGYYTMWLDKGMTKSVGNNEIANITGLNAHHRGVEMELTYEPINELELKGMFSLGDWIWSDDVNAAIFNESQEKVADIHAYIKGVHVGNSAQMTSSFTVGWKPFKGFKVFATGLYAGKNYADFDPTNRTKETDKVDAWKMPDYFLLDMGANYQFKIGSLDATLYMNVDNLLDTQYVADAKDGVKHDMKSSLVYMGFGRTWATGMKIKF